MTITIRAVIRPFLRRARDARDEIALVRLRLRGAIVGHNVKIYGRLHVKQTKGSCIKIEEGAVFNSLVARNTLEARGHNIIKTLSRTALLVVGKDTGITSTTISVAQRVEIGQRVLIGSGVLITDSDHHVVSPGNVEDRRYAGFPTSQPEDGITIEDDVFIGARSIILKGVTIGKGSVIGAASVVSRSIPAGVIAAGNPCKPVRTLRA